MLGAPIHRRPDAEERRLGVPLDYLRQIPRASLGSSSPAVKPALAIAVARFFQLTKRTLGHATSCRLVDVSLPAAAKP